MADQIDPQLAKDLKKAELRYVNDESPGITRKREGRNFKYFEEGRVVQSEDALERIKKLAIPPAWTEVWICKSPTGYLQATGLDDRKRRQYIYHPDWIAHTKENKFNRILFFAKVLPEIRKKIMQDMAGEEHERDKIVATVIWLLEKTLIRIGNDEYAKENNSFGLTTLRNRHIKVRGKDVTFEFKGKSGVQHSVRISHPRIAKIIKECIELPGYEIFKYLDDVGEVHVVDSSDVNEYLKFLTGEEITAKDFRTWGGTVLSAVTLRDIGEFETEEQFKENVRLAVKKVSTHLRNTTAICRSYYIHPTILETYEKKILIPHFEKVYKNYDREKSGMPRDEFATHLLLTKYS